MKQRIITSTADLYHYERNKELYIDSLKRSAVSSLQDTLYDFLSIETFDINPYQKRIIVYLDFDRFIDKEVKKEIKELEDRIEYLEQQSIDEQWKHI